MPECFARFLHRRFRKGIADLHSERTQRPSALPERLQAVVMQRDEIEKRDQVVGPRRVDAEMHQVGLEIFFDGLLGVTRAEGD